MMSLQAIKRASDEQAGNAARLNKQPLVAFEDGYITCKWVPNIGGYKPDGWELIQVHFVDISGIGRDDEPALTLEQFFTKVKSGLGYAIIEEGQFQIHVGEFEKLESV